MSQELLRVFDAAVDKCSTKDSSKKQQKTAARLLLDWCEQTSTPLTADAAWLFIAQKRTYASFMPPVARLLVDCDRQLKDAAQKAESSAIDCAPPQPQQQAIGWEALLSQCQSNLQSSQDMLAKATQEAAQLRQEKAELTSKLTMQEHLIDACLRFVQGEKKYNHTTAFLPERTEIKRVLVQMQRWTAS